MRTKQVLIERVMPGVTRIASDDRFPRPHVGVMGSVHGNERCGLSAIRRLHESARHGVAVPSAGTWVLIHGNPTATRQRRRYTRGGTDLNRLFDFAFEEELARERWTVEHERASALRETLEDLDALIDLHSAGSPTPPFAMVNDVPDSSRIASQLGIRYVVDGWAEPGLLLDRVSIGVSQRRGRVGISVECGQHDAEDTPVAALEIAQAYLRACGVLEGEVSRGETIALRITEIIARPSEGCRFTRRLKGLERLTAGEVFAKDRVVELSVREPCYVLLPNDGVPVGRDMVFLAQPSDRAAR